MKRRTIITVVLILIIISFVLKIKLFRESKDSEKTSECINIINSLVAGDDLLGMTIQECNVTNEGYEHIIFNGEFKISGEIRINTAGSSEYVMLCDSDEVFGALPHMKTWDKGSDFVRYYPFELIDNLMKLDNYIDDQILKELFNNEGTRYKITIVGNSFDYEFNPSTDILSKINIKDIVSFESIKDIEDNGLILSDVDLNKVKADIVVAKVIDIKEDGLMIIEDINGGSLIRKNESDTYETIKELRPWRRYNVQLKDTAMSEAYKAGDLIKLMGVYNHDTNTIIQTDDDYFMLRYEESY